jgi:hypothetical protein
VAAEVAELATACAGAEAAVDAAWLTGWAAVPDGDAAVDEVEGADGAGSAGAAWVPAVVASVTGLAAEPTTDPAVFVTEATVPVTEPADDAEPVTAEVADVTAGNPPGWSSTVAA